MGTIKQVYAYYDRSQTYEVSGYKFCPYCQTELSSKESGGRERPTCPACGFIHFRNPLPAVCVVILDGNRVLLGKRTAPPGAGKWAIPSGYIEVEDDYISTAIQEAKEETGLDVEIQSVFNVLSSFYSPRYHFLVIYVIAKITGGTLQAGDDMAEVAWFQIGEALPDLAFQEDADFLQTLTKQEPKGIPIQQD
jgi:8-oxo-dGTP diphosphatase